MIAQALDIGSRDGTRAALGIFALFAVLLASFTYMAVTHWPDATPKLASVVAVQHTVESQPLNRVDYPVPTEFFNAQVSQDGTLLTFDFTPAATACTPIHVDVVRESDSRLSVTLFTSGDTGVRCDVRDTQLVGTVPVPGAPMATTTQIVGR